MLHTLVRIPIVVVNKVLQQFDLEVLHSLQYLDGLFERDPKAGGENHERQVELYAKYDAEKLLPFLRSCNDIPLQKVSLISLIPSSFCNGNEATHAYDHPF